MAKRALLIGIDQYLDEEISPLTCASRDAVALDILLKDRCGFQTKTLTNRQATTLNITEAMRSLCGKLTGPGDTFLFYFAGHGQDDPRGQQMLLAVDFYLRNEEDGLPLGWIPVRGVENASARCGATRFVILDSCRTPLRADTRTRDGPQCMAEAAARDIERMVTEEARDNPPLVTVCSCSAGQRAHEADSLGRGIFSQALETLLREHLEQGREFALPGTGLEELAQATSRLMRENRCPGRQDPVVWSNRGRVILLPGRSEAAPSVAPASAPSNVVCPACGLRNAPEETFRCVVCGKDFLCVKHYRQEDRCCEDCVSARAWREQYEQQAKARQLEEEDFARFAAAAAAAETDGRLSPAIAVAEQFQQAHPRSPRGEAVADGLARLRCLEGHLREYDRGLLGEFPQAQASIDSLRAMRVGEGLLGQMARRLAQAVQEHESCVRRIGPGRQADRAAELDAALEQALLRFPGSPALNELERTWRHEQAYGATLEEATKATRGGNPARAAAVWDAYLERAGAPETLARFDAWPALRRRVDSDLAEARRARENLEICREHWAQFEEYLQTGQLEGAEASTVELEAVDPDSLGRQARQRLERAKTHHEQALWAARQALDQRFLRDAGERVREARQRHSTSQTTLALEEEIQRETAQRDEWIQMAREAEPARLREALECWRRVQRADRQWPECREAIERLLQELSRRRRTLLKRVGWGAACLALVVAGLVWNQSQRVQLRNRQILETLNQREKAAVTEVALERLADDYVRLLKDAASAARLRQKAIALREVRRELESRNRSAQTEKEWSELARDFTRLLGDEAAAAECQTNRLAVIRADLERARQDAGTAERWDALGREFLDKLGDAASAKECWKRRDALFREELAQRKGRARTEADWLNLARAYREKLGDSEAAAECESEARARFQPLREALLGRKRQPPPTAADWRKLGEDFKSQLQDTAAAEECFQKANELDALARQELERREKEARTPADFRALEESALRLNDSGAVERYRGNAVLAAAREAWNRLTDASAQKPYENSLGMEFVPMPGFRLLICRHETRRRDYAKFAAATRREWPPARFAETNECQPAVNVNYYDAIDFCKWLTEKERQEYKIGPGQCYRLPTDLEWSQAVRLPPESGKTPRERSGGIQGVYPWEGSHPPLKTDGNYGATFRYHPNATLVVGSFKANRFGILDLGGNAWEWCSDAGYDTNNLAEKGVQGEWIYGVLRGGSWFSVGHNSELSSYRFKCLKTDRRDFNGFRCVLEIEPALSP